MRPTCEKILQSPALVNRMNEQIVQVDEVDPEFMKTIIFPKKLHCLTERLPKPNYIPLKTRTIDKSDFLQSLIISRGKFKTNRSLGGDTNST